MLFDKLDSKKTERKVELFFKHDLDRLLLISGQSLTDLQSPSLSGMPKASSHVTGESKIIRGLNAGAILQAVTDAVNALREDESEFITTRYIDRHGWEYTKQALKMSDSTLSDVKHRALIHFADAFDYWQRADKCEAEHLVDLHAYADQVQAK